MIDDRTSIIDHRSSMMDDHSSIIDWDNPRPGMGCGWFWAGFGLVWGWFWLVRLVLGSFWVIFGGEKSFWIGLGLVFGKSINRQNIKQLTELLPWVSPT